MPEENYFEVGLSRHAPKQEKKGETVDVRKQEVDQEAAGEELENRTRDLLENLEIAPEGAIMALEPSNVKRAEQTRGLYIDKLKDVLKERQDIEVVELGENREEATKLLERIKNDPKKKFIISDLRGTWLIGFKDDEAFMPAVNKWKNALKGDEHLIGKIWAAHKNELSELVQELKQRGIEVGVGDINPGEFKTTPEDQVIRVTRWMEAMKKIGQSHFPDRPLILEGVSHNLRADYTSLALLGEDISLESINRVMGGKFRNPFERSSLNFNTNGTVTIKYRDIEKTYTQEEFSKVLEKVKENRKKREEEWSSQ